MDKLKVFKENIFLWYNFSENANALIYSKDKDYIDLLKSKLNIVDENSEDMLDYVIFISENNIFDKMQKLQSRLKKESKIIIIGKNNLSAENISNYPMVEKSLQASDNCNSIKNIKNKIKDFGFCYNNVYYAFPNYEMADIIFKENYNITSEQIEKYIPNVFEKNIKLFDEIEFLKKIVNENREALDMFANAYFIEFSQEDIEQDVNYVSFNNTRKEEFRLMTIIRDEVAQKTPVNEKSKIHLENMITNIDLLKKENINLLDYSENGKCYSKLVKENRTLDVLLANHYNDLDYIVNKLTKIKEILNNTAIDYNNDVEQALKEYNIELEKISKLKFLENAFVDFVPKNCFEINNEMYFFDQEWRRKYLPVEFILYRSIINCYELVKKININDLYQRLGIIDYIDVFEKINQKIMNDVLDEDLYKIIFDTKVIKIDNIINERLIALSQIEGYKEEDLKKTEVIKDMQEEDSKKNKVIEDFEKENKNKEKVIEDFEKENKNKEKFIEGLTQAIEVYKAEENKKANYIQDLQNEEKNKLKYIADLESVKEDNKNEIARLNEINHQKDEIINSLNEIIKVKDEQITIYENMTAVKIIKKLKRKK